MGVNSIVDYKARFSTSTRQESELSHVPGSTRHDKMEPNDISSVHEVRIEHPRALVGALSSRATM